jgi:hypothetical protein
MLLDVNDMDFHHIFASSGSGKKAGIFVRLLIALKQPDQPFWGGFDHTAMMVLDALAAIGNLLVSWLINDNLIVQNGFISGTGHLD